MITYLSTRDVSGGTFSGIMRQVKATFYLPLYDNDGRSLAAEISSVEDQCYEAFGAWTAAGFFKGAWRMKSGYQKVDACAVYVIVVDEEQISAVENILREFKSHTSQEAIYLEIDRDVDLRLI